MKLASFLFCLLACAALANAEAVQYSRTVSFAGQSVVRCPLTPEKAAELHALAEELELDIWAVHPEAVDIRVKQYQLTPLQARLGQCQPFIADLEARLQDWESGLQKNAAVENKNWHESYHRYEEIVSFYQQLASKFDTVTFKPSIGRSVEGRDQPALVITAPDGKQKNAIYFQFQIHAREWISSATGMYVLEKLVTDYANGDEEVKKLLSEVEIHCVLFVNPDGYEETWNNNRLWRKNRGANPGSSCLGTDLNRNYDDHWGEGGSSTNPCSETYMGPAPASAPEVQNTMAYFKSVRPVLAGIDFHSYSQLLLRPYGWTRNDSPHEREIFGWGADMAAAIRSNGGMTYRNIKSIELYKTTGSAGDWFYGDGSKDNQGYLAASWTLELRDTGRYGFLLPPDQIIPTGKEVYAGLRAVLPKILANPLRA